MFDDEKKRVKDFKVPSFLPCHYFHSLCSACLQYTPARSFDQMIYVLPFSHFSSMFLCKLGILMLLANIYSRNMLLECE